MVGWWNKSDILIDSGSWTTQMSVTRHASLKASGSANSLALLFSLLVIEAPDQFMGLMQNSKDPAGIL